MKGLTGEWQDLKDWTAYLIDLLSRGKRDVTALKVLIVLALIVVPGGILLQSSGGVFSGASAVLSPISSLFNGLLSGPAATATPDDHTHTGVFDPNFKPTPYIWTGSTDKPLNTQNGTPIPTSTPIPDNGTSPTPTTGPTANPTTGPTPGPTGTPIPSRPVADFSGSPLGIIAGNQVTFTDHSSNSPTSWSWNFGDGSTSTAQSPAHTYATAGDYDVTLTATNAYGSNTMVKAAYVHVFNSPPPVPVANFIASPLSVTLGQDITFTDQSSNSPTEWAWNFGDGSGNSSLQSPHHTYAAAGVYTVTLTAISAGGSNTLVRNNYITVTLPPVPVADFTASPTSIVAGQTVTFTDASSNAPTSWSWDFGDGQTSTSQSPTHAYAAAGDYTVTLTASNAGGSSSPVVKTAYIHVTASAPVASFTPSATSITTGGSITFTDTSSNAPTSWSWDFGDGQTSTSQSPAHTFATAGDYTVTMTVSNAGGSDSVTVVIHVTDPLPPAPVASFTASSTSINAGDTVTFTDTSSNAPTSWSWNFGDGQTSTSQSPANTFADPGDYTVTLTASNAGGSDMATVVIHVV